MRVVFLCYCENHVIIMVRDIYCIYLVLRNKCSVGLLQAA